MTNGWSHYLFLSVSPSLLFFSFYPTHFFLNTQKHTHTITKNQCEPHSSSDNVTYWAQT